MKPPQPASLLVDLPDDQRLWSNRTWTDFARARPSPRRVALLPVCGLVDWGLGRPLDLEETLATAVLRETGTPDTVAILPPLRWTVAAYPHGGFGVDLETAVELITSIAASVKQAGFTKLVLFTAGPWNEELSDIAGRQARAHHDLQVFLITLASLGLDLHPTRTADRSAVVAAACTCFGTLPKRSDVAPGDMRLTKFRPGHIRTPVPALPKRSLKAEVAAGRTALTAAAKHLSSLLAEVVAAKPLTARAAPSHAKARRRT